MNAQQQRFVDDLGRLGCEPQVAGPLVEYLITPVDGAHAGERVATGVDLTELVRWPIVPPHWVHVPGEISFARTNSRPSPRSGWLMHSRNISPWGVDTYPARSWVAHVRGVLGQAIT